MKQSSSKLFFLLAIEFNRIMVALLPMTILYTVIQLISCFYKVNEINRTIEEIANAEMKTIESVIEARKGTFGMSNVVEGNTVLSIGVIILLAGLVFYCLASWYIEWFSRNKTIYTLLLLPYSRIKIYLIKALSVLMSFGVIVAAFIINVLLNFLILKSFLYNGLLQQNALISELRGSSIIATIAPTQSINILVYVFCLCAFIGVLFGFPLLERGGGWLGAIIAILQLIIFPYVFIWLSATSWLFTSETIILQLLWCTLFITISIISARLLLNRKIAA